MKEFYLSEFFSILSCGKEKTENIIKGTKHPFVTAKVCNNGVHCLTDEGKHLFIGNTLILVKDGDGAGGLPYYQKDDFYANSHIIILSPKINMNREIGLYLVSSLRKCKNFFNHTRAINRKTFNSIKVILPSKDGVTPDWSYMKDFITNLENRLTLPKKYKYLNKFRDYFCEHKTKEVFFENPHKFALLDLFTNFGCGTEIIYACKAGDTPLVSSGSENNGITAYISDGNSLFTGNKITLAKNGSIGKCFYQKEDFYATSDVLILGCNNLNLHIALFLIPIIEQKATIYTWNNKIDNQVLNKISLTLPAVEKDNGTFEPDWKFMENYIKSLPYSNCI